MYITGSLAFEKGSIKTVKVTHGLTGPAVDAALSALGLTLGDVVPGIPWTGAGTAELSFMTIGASNVHAFVGIGGPYWTDTDLDGQVDHAAHLKLGQAAELNSSAKGLWIQNFDFGMAIMKPTNRLDFVKYFALKASADQISLVGIEGVQIVAHDILVEINQSTPSIYGVPLFPVVDFASTFHDERLALFNIFASAGDSVAGVSQADLDAVLGTGHVITQTLTTVEQLVELLNVGGAPPDGILSVIEVLQQLNDGLSPEALQALKAQVLAADIDGDGKFDPIGYEVNTGGDPVYLTMNSPLIRAQGFLQLNLFDTVFLTGSVAFELGPRQHIVLTDGTPKEVTTMTIGAANVTAFIGTGGPYWTDLNGNHQVDALTELNAGAIGFHITNFDMGVMVMASTNPSDLGVYLAAKASVSGLGIVEVNALSATGQFDVALNVGIGASGLDLNVKVVDFQASFSEVLVLFDTDHDGKVTVGELRVLAGQGTDGAFTGLYTDSDAGTKVVSLATLVAALDATSAGRATTTGCCRSAKPRPCFPA